MNVVLLFESMRPKTLVASIAPVMVGTSLAYSRSEVVWYLVPFVVLCAVLIQLLSNWVNDLYDFRRGADVIRLGPRRMLSLGLIPYSTLRTASWAVVILCLLLSIPILQHSGWPIFLVGAVCMVSAWAYTGGPFALAYQGLGDVAAFLLFGVVAVCGTFYVHTGMLTQEVFIISLGPGLLVANILAVNNIRDIVTDGAVGKRTLAVRLGADYARMLYATLLGVALLLPLLLLSTRGIGMTLPLITIPIAVIQIRLVFSNEAQQLNKALAGTAGLYLLYAVLLSVALLAT